MEEKAAGADDEVAEERDEVDAVMAVFETVADAFDAEPHEEEVCDGVDDLGGIVSSIVVLAEYVSYRLCKREICPG